MSYWRLFYHVIWGAKNRLPMIDEKRERVLLNLLPGIARSNDSMTHAIGIMPDHVHIVLSIPPKAAISTVVAKLKGVSSHYLSHDPSAAPHKGWLGWQPEYAVLSFAERDLDSVVQYVTHQKERHNSQQLNDQMEYMVVPITGIEKPAQNTELGPDPETTLSR